MRSNNVYEDKDDDFEDEGNGDQESEDIQEVPAKMNSNARRRLEELREQRELDELIKDDFDFDD